MQMNSVPELLKAASLLLILFITSGSENLISANEFSANKFSVVESTVDLDIITNGDTTQPIINLHSRESIKKFADYLFCQRDYLRAYEEYEKYHPAGSDDTVKFKMALSLRNLDRFRKAEEMFISLGDNSNLSDQAKLELFKTRFFSSDYTGLKNLFRGYSNFPEKYSRQIRGLYYLSFLYSDGNLPDEESFLQAFPVEHRDQLKEFYLCKKDPPYRSPVTAAVFSAIIPGSGKIYTKNYGDGITSFIVTGLMGYLAYDNFKSNHNFRGWAFSSLAAFFYAGNIYGSAASAQIFNAAVSYDFSNQLTLFLNKNHYFLAEDENFCK